MEQLAHLLRKTAATKKLHSTWYMGIILRIIGDVIGVVPEHGYIKHGVLILRIADHGKKMILFREKTVILEKIMTTLKEYGYTIRVQDIRFMG